MLSTNNLGNGILGSENLRFEGDAQNANFAEGTFNADATQEHAVSLLVLDESGSMSSMREAVVEMYNSLVLNILRESQEMPALLQHLNVYAFNSSRIAELLPLQTVESGGPNLVLGYRPRGGTPLYDCLGTSLSRLEARLDASGIPEENLKVSVAIFTDGMENDSRNFSLSEVKALILRLKERGWEFVYYGTDHPVEDIAHDLGVNRGVRFDKSSQGFRSAMDRYNSESKMSKEDFLRKKGKF
jgi:Mg-chelatase subunit ChlD